MFSDSPVWPARPTLPEEAGPDQFTIVLPEINPLLLPGSMFVISAVPTAGSEVNESVVFDAAPGIGGERPFQLTGLHPNTTYHVVVKLRNSTSVSAPGAPLLISTEPHGRSSSCFLYVCTWRTR